MASPAAAGTAAPAAGEAAQGDGGDANAQGQQEGQQAPDVQAALASITTMLESQHDLLQSEPWKPAPAAEEPQEPAAPDLSFLDDSQPSYTPEMAAKGLQDLVQQLASEQAKQLVEPIAKQQKDMQVRQETDDLIGRFPQMGDDAVAQQVVKTSAQWAEMLGHPELAASPQVWELVYLAGRAADQANQEAGASPGAAALEGPGGASPGGSGQGDLPTTQSVTSGWGGNSLPLFGTKQR